MTWHVRDCGVRAVAAVTDRPVEDVKREFVDLFGSFEVCGKQMRAYLTERGWVWNRVRQQMFLPWPAVVVTRRGFYPVIDGRVVDRINAPICGWYTREADA